MQANYDNKLRWQSFDKLGGENHYKSIGPRERVLIMKESARRKFDRACKGTSSLKEQQDLWDMAQEVTLTKLKRQTTVWNNVENERHDFHVVKKMVCSNHIIYVNFPHAQWINYSEQTQYLIELRSAVNVLNFLKDFDVDAK